MIRLLEEYEHMFAPCLLTCINYGSLRDIFLQGLIVWKIHHVVASRTYTDVADISPKECPKQTSTNLGPQIAYVVNINQTNLILTKM